MKSSIFALALLLSLVALTSCGGDGSDSTEKTASTETTSTSGQEVHGDEVKPSDVTLTTPLNQEWVSDGKGIYDVKCQGCHKLSDERVVGPGWKGVTERREPHWIMNMITNVDMMLEKDPEAQKLLEQCLVRMPNQNLNRDQARHVLEFMRSNDGVK
ncbi:MAG: cytochrome c [Chitinophagaceae bacterium]|nr:cytochrome c [Chitinophagaceae bacterium]